MKTEHVLFHPFFFKITDPFDGRSFLMCSHDPFFRTNKNRILKNGSCERDFILISVNLNFKMKLFSQNPSHPCLPQWPFSTGKVFRSQSCWVGIHVKRPR